MIDDIDPDLVAEYRREQRRIRRLRRALEDHEHPLDPERPEYSYEDLDELERENERLME